MEKLFVPFPVLVEGKYDKIKLDSILDAQILTTDGFGIFKKAEFTSLLRRLAERTQLIVLTDSDGAGLVIRNYVNSILPKERLIHLYIPPTQGKEKRKSAPSKEGLLGVEGMDADCLRALFAPFGTESAKVARDGVTKADFYRLGYSGATDSSARRQALIARLGLPKTLSANALLCAINLLYDRPSALALLGEVLK